MTPGQMIADLDDSLLIAGQTITLKRGSPSAPSAMVMVKGTARDYRLQELTGQLKQGDTHVVLSPTGLGSYGLPKRGDFVVISGRTRSVESAVTFEPQDVVVRIELVVRG